MKARARHSRSWTSLPTLGLTSDISGGFYCETKQRKSRNPTVREGARLSTDYTECAVSTRESVGDLYPTARSVVSSPLSIIAKASRSSASVIQSGGFVKKVFQRTNV